MHKYFPFFISLFISIAAVYLVNNTVFAEVFDSNKLQENGLSGFGLLGLAFSLLIDLLIILLLTTSLTVLIRKYFFKK